MKLGVYGSAAKDTPKEINEKARELGREIARLGHITVTGGCNGYPYEAVLGASELFGDCIAYSPGTDKWEHKNIFGFPTEGFTTWEFVPQYYDHIDEKQACIEYRSQEMVRSVDAGIVIGGETGTMIEYCLSFNYGKNIGILKDSGGITEKLEDFMTVIKKDRGSNIIYESDPIKLVRILAETN